jgi:serine protease AprX
MAATTGPLLSEVLSRVETEPGADGFLAVASDLEQVDGPAETIAVTALFPHTPPDEGEAWDVYEHRVLDVLAGWMNRLEADGIRAEPMVSSTGLQFRADPERLRHIQREADDIELLELDPLLSAAALDDVGVDLDLAGFRAANPGIDGAGVGVAVIDSGIDEAHPFLTVHRSATTCSEPVDRPGTHGTHCGGIIASRDTAFGGIAPGARLINLKAGRADSRFMPGDVSRAFDQAGADPEVEIISASLGFNHLPRLSMGGHGWGCAPPTLCQLCRSVDTSVRRGKLVVVAAGNEHERAEALRRAGEAASLDTELCCPGQFREALTIGSVAKSTFLPAPTSSRGPSSWGADKPDLAAPGVNVTSTIPAPRDGANAPLPNPARADLFGRQSGTSMATAVVAGLAALAAERARAAGANPTANDLRQAVLATITSSSFGPSVVGAGIAHSP